MTSRTPHKLDGLTNFLRSSGQPTVILSFAELKRLADIPESATRHVQWWANSQTSRPHSAAWLDVGYRANPDIPAGLVRFVKGFEEVRVGPSTSRQPRGLA